MWKISKSFEFCFGHRVWTQVLNEDLALTTHCKCRHLHGHQGKVEICIHGMVNMGGLVLDFTELNFVKKFIDDTLDHKMILDINDPITDRFFPQTQHDRIQFPPGYWKLQARKNMEYEATCEEEIFGGIVLVAFVPTAELMAAFFFNVVKARLVEALPEHYGNALWVDSVTFYETPKTSSTYSAPLLEESGVK